MRRITLLSVAISLLATVTAPAADLQSMVVGIGHDELVVASGIPYTSGRWGTDYLALSHLLGLGKQYTVTTDGMIFDEAEPITACSRFWHGIDLVVLRVKTHAWRPVFRFGRLSDLKPDDKLLLLPYRGIQQTPEEITFRHHRLDQYAATNSLEWRNTMVAKGNWRPGFSGAPWVRKGLVYGLHKGEGTVLSEGKEQHVILAEPQPRIAQCLERVGYKFLIPK